MKKILLSTIILILCFTFGMNSQSQTNPVDDTTEIIFNETDHNFGILKYQGDGTFEFIFKNTGKTPLIIKHVQSTCGCTVPEWDKQPIPPKGKGKVVVRYNTELIGSFIKTIKVYSNAKNSPVDLTIRGEVKN